MRFSVSLVSSFLVLAAACETTTPAPGTDAGITDGGHDASTVDAGDDASTVDAGDDASTVDAGDDAQVDAGPVPQITLDFSVDDRANHTYETDDGLAWKGSFAYDAATNTITRDPAWAGPFPMLYDDGPIASGGHEPAGSTAGDHIWGVSVLFESPSSAVSFEYGAIRGAIAGSTEAWIWIGPNGTFDVPAGSTAPITVPGLVIPAFGEIDLRLTLDVGDNGARLATEFQGMTYGTVSVRGVWGLSETTVMVDDATHGDAVAGDGIYTGLASTSRPAHVGLFRLGDQPHFVFVLGTADYRVGTAASSQGATAASDHPAPGACATGGVGCVTESIGVEGDLYVVIGPTGE